MHLHVEATYENGVLKLDEPLPLTEKQRVSVTVYTEPSRVRQREGVIKWTGSVDDLEYLAESPDLDPAERLNDVR
jgi:predicted DNA-binding antitoxin AbrB/MazE fold protein